MKTSNAVLLFGALSLGLAWLHHLSLTGDCYCAGLIMDWAFSIYSYEGSHAVIHGWHEKISWLDINEWRIRQLLLINSLLFSLLAWVLARRIIGTDTQSLNYSCGLIFSLVAVSLTFRLGWLLAILVSCWLAKIRGRKMPRN